jgi:probable O-glycosylation ligase (exosortase A-associated)
MRNLALLSALITALALTLRYPFVGTLLWAWIALQNPHQEAYGFLQTAPVNLVVALTTVVSWLISRERKSLRNDGIFWLIVLFLAWMTFNSFFAVSPSFSWPFWNDTWKRLALGLVIALMANSRLRIYALIWIVVISLFYYGVKGGLFTLVTGGHFHVFGPPNSMIADNNMLAVALLMTLPLANFLRTQVASRLIAWIFIGCSILTIVAILGTYSRGALIGLAALGVFASFRARNRIAYLGIIGVVAIFVFNFMPAHFFHRMDSIGVAQQDASFEGRVHAWKVATMYASTHFPFGAGFNGPALGFIYNRYYPGEIPHVAHSIYFEVLGDHGFIGLAIYLAILASAFLRCAKTIRATRDRPELRWAHDLAIAIQSSLFVFCIAGAALSMAYYDLFIIELGLLLPLYELAVRDRAISKQSWSPSMRVGVGTAMDQLGP